MFEFVQATKEKAKARIALVGPSGAGKTYTALRLATAFGGPIVVLDTERGSASKYSQGEGFGPFLVPRGLDRFDPRKFPELLREASKVCHGGTLIIDSLTAWWSGIGGMQEMVDAITKASASKNSFQAWGTARPVEKAMFDAMLSFPAHVIVTMRAKTEYVMDEVTGRDGKKRQQPRKVGLAPEQRNGIEYEFDIVGDMTIENELVVSKSRCRSVRERGHFMHPGDELAKLILDWLNDGVDAAPPVAPSPLASHDDIAPQTPRSGSDLTPDLLASDLLARLNKATTRGELAEMWTEINEKKNAISPVHLAFLTSRKNELKAKLTEAA